MVWWRDDAAGPPRSYIAGWWCGSVAARVAGVRMKESAFALRATARQTSLCHRLACRDEARPKGERSLAGSTGLEPAASGVTGRRSNQLNYDPNLQSPICNVDCKLVGGTGLEPVTAGV